MGYNSFAQHFITRYRNFTKYKYNRDLSIPRDRKYCEPERDQFLLYIQESRFKYLSDQSALADSGL